MAIATALEVRNLEQFKSAMLLHLTNVKEAALRGYRERQKLTSYAHLAETLVFATTCGFDE